MSEIEHLFLPVADRVTLHVAAAGPQFGPPVLLVHGWPECWLSWRAIGLRLARLGYRVLMPDLRGFGESSCPAEPEQYGMQHVTGDLVGLLDVLELPSAVIVGHDWGGATVWSMAMHHPDRVAAVASVCTALMPRSKRDPVELMQKRPRQFDYQLHFQQEGLAEAEFTGQEERLFTAMMRRWDDMPQEMNMSNVRERGGLLVGVPELPRSDLLSEEELREFVAAYRRSGWHGGLGFYRNLSANWERDTKLGPDGFVVRQPALMVTAEQDFVLHPSMTKGMEERVPLLQRATIDNCGHWAQLEQPEELGRILEDWLAGLPRASFAPRARL